MGPLRVRGQPYLVSGSVVLRWITGQNGLQPDAQLVKALPPPFILLWKPSLTNILLALPRACLSFISSAFRKELKVKGMQLGSSRGVGRKNMSSIFIRYKKYL